MSAPGVRAYYDEPNQISRSFGQEAQAIQTMIQALRRKRPTLENGVAILSATPAPAGSW